MTELADAIDSTITDATHVCEDLQEWAAWVDRLPRSTGTLLYIDAAIAGSTLDHRVSAILDRRGSIRRRVINPRTDIADLRTDVSDAPTADGFSPEHPAADGALVVGVGGGGVMDRAKLVALLAGDRQAELRLTTPHRCGFIAVPVNVRRRLPLALIPTTIGTGADLSQSACVEVRHRKRLVFGKALRADSVVHLAEATDHLPVELVAEGILEALLRLSAAYAGSLGDLPEQDALVEGYVTRLIQLGDAVKAARDAQTPVAGDIRLAAARISAASHTDEVLDGRDRYCDIAWPLAHELSSSTGKRKLTALAAVTPAVWRCIAFGDERVGSATRLARLWLRMRLAAEADLGSDPATGLTALINHWDIDTRTDASATSADALAGRAAQAWGRGLPMLKGLAMHEISAIYAEALSTKYPDHSQMSGPPSQVTWTDRSHEPPARAR